MNFKAVSLITTKKIQKHEVIKPLKWF